MEIHISLVEETMISEIDRWQYGNKYVLAFGGELFIGRERGVKLGEVRAFVVDRLHNTSELYYAERSHKSIIPFRAPVIWWRKLEK